MNTVSEIEFTDKQLGERWSRVQTDFWGDLKGRTLIALKNLLEGSMEIEIQDLVGAGRWERVRKNRLYRKGSYFRSVLTSMGLISLLKVPRIRGGGMTFKTLPQYVQRTPDVDKGVLEMFLAGVSTRRVKEVIAPLMGKPTVSSSTVSQIGKMLDSHVQGFHGRRLSDDYNTPENSDQWIR